jgi:phospholipase/lecithinase/hemolysin
MRTVSPIALLLMIVSITVSMPAWPYSAFYVFGDSLSDVGNLYLADGGALPAPPYAGGRFSNGPNWAEGLAARLGTGPLTPSSLGGTDYAFGGAGTGAPVPGVPAGVPNLQQQVQMFGLSTGFAAPSTALYGVWAGSNDIFAILGALGVSITLPQAMADAAGAAVAEAAAIQTLAGDGARSFLVPLLPDLGVTPFLNTSPTAAFAASLLAATFNDSLNAALHTTPELAGLDLFVPNTFADIDAIVANPGAYGFTNVSGACYVGPQTGGGTVCANPAQWLFWDSVHPTAAGQALMADAAARSIPEPATLTILLVGLGAMVLRGRWPAQAAIGPLLLLAACDYHSVVETATAPVNVDGRVQLAAAPCTSRAQARGRDLAAEATRRFATNLQAAPEFALSGEGRYRLRCEVVDYQEGSPIKRWIMPGWGQTAGKVSATVTDSSTDQTVLAITGEERLGAGGLYTIGAESYIVDTAIDDLVRQLRTWARGEPI